MNARADRFPLIDSLRAIAALSVLGFHAAFFAGAFTSGSPLRPFLAQLNTGVSVFFLISGFLLYRPFVRARLDPDSPPWPSTGAYAWRRFLRIVPAYWVALTGVALWLGLSQVAEPAWHIPVYYGFAQIYWESTGLGGLGQAWTLCVEVTFYALLPLWGLAARRLRLGFRGELIALALLWLFSLAWKLFALRHVGDPSGFGVGPWLMPLPNFLDQFAVGMALALVSVHGLPSRLAPLAARSWPWWLLAALAYWALCTRIGFEGRLREPFGQGAFLARHELATVVALGLLVPAVFAWERRDVVRRVLAWRPLLYVGLVSYGVYLWHFAVVFEIAKGISRWMARELGFGVEARFLVLFALGSAGAVAIASVSYYLVERPALSLKRLVGPPPERGEAVAEPAPAAPAQRR
jgi:peptidoglycan/LPS O-acetylase OafA/YrhL